MPNSAYISEKIRKHLFKVGVHEDLNKNPLPKRYYSHQPLFF